MYHLISYLFMVFVKLNLYGYKTWSLAVRKERRLRVFESVALRRIFGHMKDEVTRDWRRLHNEELHDLYPQNIIRMIRSIRMRWARHVARIGERKGACRVLVGRPEGKRPLGRPNHRW